MKVKRQEENKQQQPQTNQAPNATLMCQAGSEHGAEAN
jgi:hypothetical protein